MRKNVGLFILLENRGKTGENRKPGTAPHLLHLPMKTGDSAPFITSSQNTLPPLQQNPLLLGISPVHLPVQYPLVPYNRLFAEAQKHDAMSLTNSYYSSFKFFQT